jgi:hypothetical protein
MLTRLGDRAERDNLTAVEVVVAETLLVVIASTGPFGPTVVGMASVLLLIVGPFLLLAIIARSLLGSDPVPLWLLALTTIGVVGLAFLLWPARITDRWSGFWGVWRITGIAALVLSPAVAFMEAGKRDFFRRPDRFKRPSNKKRRVKRDRTARPDDRTGGNGVFVRDDS